MITEDQLVAAHKLGRKLAITHIARGYGRKYGDFAAHAQSQDQYNNKDQQFAFWAGYNQERKRRSKESNK